MATLASRRTLFALLFILLAFLGPVALAVKDGFVPATIDGKKYLVRDDRRPSLYTKDYGDCMGGSSINVTRFDAAYYKDNMTVLFHLGGETALKNESIIMYIGVFAYGEARFDLTFNPCSANIKSACPLRAGFPVEASGIIPISQKDVAGIPPIAMSIPDFEGQAILRIFSNSTQSEIGCYSGVVTNGSSFSQQAWVSSILGAFTIIAVLSSFVTVIVGDNFPEIRKHYAHLFSVLVTFAAWQHIYFTGALSMNWPSVLVAFWSNYAWAGGMIYSEAMQNTINKFIGSNKGNTTVVGAADTGMANPELGGGYDIQEIYNKRHEFTQALDIPGLDNTIGRRFEDVLTKRELVDSASGYTWYGHPVKPGIPLPGNYSGFAGTLAQDSIPASNAFMTGLMWFLVLLAGIIVSVAAFKFLIEGMHSSNMIKRDRLAYFRAHWLGYTALAVLRTLYICFFMLMFLALFQFSYLTSPKPIAVAWALFLVLILVLGGLAGYALFYGIKFGHYASEPDYLNIEKRWILKVFPWFGIERNSSCPRSEDKKYAGFIPWWRVRPAPEESSIHDNEEYIKKFGWLAARFRKTRWWFFSAWLVYELVRACFLAGASGSPLLQVFGLLAAEVIAFIGIIILKPFEGQRLNVIVVYFLGFSKIATVGLSVAFDKHFGIPRIIATVIGLVIIVIQGILTTAVLVAIMLGAVTSYMSITRNRHTIRPTRWISIRQRYFNHLDLRMESSSRPRKTKMERAAESVPEPEIPKGPYFSVKNVRRMAKVEDEDEEYMNEINNFSTSRLSLPPQYCGSINATPEGRTTAPSLQSRMSYSSLPYGAHLHREIWSTQDFTEHFVPGRPKTVSNPVVTPEDARRPKSRVDPPFITRIAGSESAARKSSPLSASVSRSITPVAFTGYGEGSGSSIPRPSTPHPERLPSGSRRQLRALVSESGIPLLPMTCTR